MSKRSKNQTVMERAAIREARGMQLSAHICASPTCPNAGKPIAVSELYPVVTFTPRQRTLFYHRTCGPRVGSGS